MELLVKVSKNMQQLTVSSSLDNAIIKVKKAL